MNLKRSAVALAIGALLLLAFSDCMSAMTMDQHSMQCCGSMPCTPMNHSHGCCQRMISPETPSILPAAHVSLDAPVVAILEYPPALVIVWETSFVSTGIRTLLHSPPPLYTLNASLLI